MKMAQISYDFLSLWYTILSMSPERYLYQLSCHSKGSVSTMTLTVEIIQEIYLLKLAKFYCASSLLDAC